MSEHDPHQAPGWLPALIAAPPGGVVTVADDAPPAGRIAVGMAVDDGVAPAVGTESEPVRLLPIAVLRPHPGQPRRSMDEAELHALAESIAEQGVIQPIVVRPAAGSDGGYEIIAGERRWRAARLAGLSAIPALVRALDDAAMAEVALVENIQRADLAPLDEAQAYQTLMDAHGRTQEEIARRLGKNRSHVAHMLRLLRLPEDVRALIGDGGISVGHARILVNAADPSALARRIVAEGLTVRQTEEAAKSSRPSLRPGPEPRRPSEPARPGEGQAWAARFGAALARPVAVKPGRQGGSLVIPYDSEDDLASILARIGPGSTPGG